VPAFAAIGALLGACADTTAGANTATVHGTWRYVETLESVSDGIACADTGVYRWTQSGTVFAGDYVQRGVCRTPLGVVNNADSGGVSDGRIVGRSIRFRASLFCEYDGLREAAVERITGRAVCVLSNATDTLRLAGVWSATR
jgi:hypothetical protein